jgi:hypothetical protein
MSRSFWRNLLRVAGALAVLAAVMPAWHYEGGAVRTRGEADHVKALPNTMPGRTEFRLGIEDSPLFRYTKETTLEELPDGGFKGRRVERGLIGWRSWSAASLALGVLLFVVASRIRPKPEPEGPKPPG